MLERGNLVSSELIIWENHCRFQRETGLDTIAQMVYEIATLTVTTIIIIHSALRLFKFFKTDWKKGSHDLTIVAEMAWLATGIFLLCLWPEALDLRLYPRRSLVFYAGISVFLFSLGDGILRQRKLQRIQKWASVILLTILITIPLALLIRYLLFVRPRMEGPDFYFYVCTARHVASGMTDISMIRYFYFPGVYTFWKMVLAFTDGTLIALQWWYFGVILVNVFLIAAIIQTVTRNLFSAAIGALWYVAFCSKFEGFIGATEPISTIPALLGLLIWRGPPLISNALSMRSLALGIGFGLALYIRQHAGLISIGAVSLLISDFVQDKNRRSSAIWSFLIVSLTALCTFLIAILLEGHGFEPILIGIRHMREYGSTVNFWNFLWFSANLIKPLALCALVTGLGWVICLLRQRHLLQLPLWQVLGFCITAGFFSLIPFFSRPHLHYGLIAAPFLIIASCLFITYLIKLLPSQFFKIPIVRYVLILGIMLPFVQPRPTSPYFFLWPPSALVKPPQQRPWRLTPGVSSDFNVLKKYVVGEHIYVLPPRQNEVHFFLGTRHYFYGWGNKTRLIDVLEKPELQGVIVIKPETLPDYVVATASERHDFDRAHEILDQHKFRPAVTLSTMTLWRKL